MAEVFDTSPWDSAGAFLDNLANTDQFKDLAIEAKAAHVNKVTDELILRLVKSHLLACNTKTEFIRFQAMVASLLQLRSHITGRLGADPNGNG